jgi:hypothetical protein
MTKLMEGIPPLLPETMICQKPLPTLPLMTAMAVIQQRLLRLLAMAVLIKLLARPLQLPVIAILRPLRRFPTEKRMLPLPIGECRKAMVRD